MQRTTLALLPWSRWTASQEFEPLRFLANNSSVLLHASLAAAGFAVEAMKSARVDLVIVRAVVLFHRVYSGGYVLVDSRVFLTVVGENRRPDLLHEIDGVWATAVKHHNRLEPAYLSCAAEGHLAAPTKSDDPA